MDGIDRQPPALSPNATGTFTDRARGYLADSVSKNTVRALRADLTVYTHWGGPLPATEASVANFLAEQAEVKKASTIARYANSLHIWHAAHGYHPSPVRTETVRRLLQGIQRHQDTRPDSPAPLLLQDLKSVLDALNGSDSRSVRNRALLAVAFFGAFRRSEVVRLRREDATVEAKGATLALRHSKTNQSGLAETKTLARGPVGSPYCPVQLLENWLALLTSRLEKSPHGPLFPGLDPRGQPKQRAMAPETFYALFKEALTRAGFDPDRYSPHSLRAGFITSAYLGGKAPFKIKRISGHRHHPTFERYLHEADRFEDNASDLL